MVASKQLRLAVEMEEERRARLENDVATKRLRLALETEEKSKKIQRKKEEKKKRNGFDLD